jgi:Arc/MetJ-type ribon-helix-helix transcriptional regulator
MSLVLDPATEDRIQRQLERGPYAAPAELINRALDLLEADDWLFQNRDAINADLEESSAQAARGEGYSPEEATALLAARRAARAA